MGQFKLGVMVHLSENIKVDFEQVKRLGLSTCQLVCWNEAYLNDYYVKLVNEGVKEYQIEITGFWCGWPGDKTWDFYEGQLNLGLVPEQYREIRIEMLKAGSDFAKKINVEDLITHVGFIPENPFDPNYKGVVEAVKEIAIHCQRNGQYFLFETGQETPITLKRIIQDIGLNNVGVNLDPANLLMYGKANPVDAVDILDEYIRGVHVKDGEYPTDPRFLGRELPIGSGAVHFDLLLLKLKEIGYSGAITIEREIDGERQIEDIKKGIRVLNEDEFKFKKFLSINYNNNKMGLKNLVHGIVFFLIYDLFLILVLCISGLLNSIRRNLTFISFDYDLFWALIYTLSIPTLFYLIRGLKIAFIQSINKTMPKTVKIINYISPLIIIFMAYISILVIGLGYILMTGQSIGAH